MNGINWGNNGIINNPYNFMPQLQMPVQQTQVNRVHGEEGVDAFQMAPNSSNLLLDETAPIIWFVQTDSAGYKTKTPYDIALHVSKPSPDIESMDERLMSIDKRLKAIEEVMNDESNN